MGNSMTIATMQYIPLACAYLCQDCNSIGNCAIQCPACASFVLMGLAGVLNREQDGKAELGDAEMSQLDFATMPAMAA